MSIRTLIRRHGGFVAVLWLTLGLGLASALAAFRLVRVSGVWPISFSPVVEATAIADTVWSGGWSPDAVTPAASQAASVRALLGVLLSLAALAALMAVVSAVTLMAMRRLAQRREFAIRSALGAAPVQLRLERRLEAAFLYGSALVLGVSGAALLAGIATQIWPAGLERITSPRGVDGALILLVLTTLILWLTSGGGHVRERELQARLRAGSATADRTSQNRGRFSAIIATALALAIASTAMSLYRHGRADTAGEEPEAAALVTLELSSPATSPRERALAYATLLGRLNAMTGVTAESLASPGAWLGLGVRDGVMVECGNCYRAAMYMPIQPAHVQHHAVSPGFFEAMRIPVLRGRAFRHTDNYDSARVAIVNQTFAQRNFERGQPVGRRVQVGGLRGQWYTIIGVVADVPARGVGAPRVTQPALYLSTQQEPPTTVGLAARSALEPVELAARVEQSTRDVAVSGIRDAVTMAVRVDRAVAPLRWFALLFAGMATAAFALAVHGVYMLVRTQTRARRRELAVRASVGASPATLSALVMASTARTAMIGLSLGAVGAWTAGRAVQMRMGGVPPIDVESAALIGLALAAAALAGALPTVARAANASPALVLRND
jgi:hypothetical protein